MTKFTSSSTSSKMIGMIMCLAMMTMTNGFSIGTSSSSSTRNSIISSSSTRVNAGPPTKQAEYGKDIPLPETYAQCGRCQSAFAIAEDDLGTYGRGRRLECGVCGHTWFQSKDRLMTLSDGFELVSLPEEDYDRIQLNIKEGKSPKFMGESKLYVGNISFASTEDDIRNLFSEVGEVGDVSLVRDENGRNRGFGFITMRTNEDGQKCIDILDGREVKGRNISVRESTN